MSVSLYKFFNRFPELMKLLFIAGFNGIHHTMIDMILQDQLADVIDRRAYCRNLNQDFVAVTFVRDHVFDGLKMSDRAVHTVHNRLGGLRVVMMSVTGRMRVIMGMGMVF